MKQFTAKGITLALFLSASGVVFADEAATVAAAACPDPQMLKSGWYLGLQGGYESYKVRNGVSTPAGSTLTTNPALAANGWVGGMMLGYGMMFNSWFYTGAEIFANINDAQRYYSSDFGTGIYINKFSVRSTYGLGLLPGIKFTDTTLNYIRLGWNAANFKVRETVTAVPVGNKKNTTNGFVFGIGMETLTYGDWSLRGEFSHTWYSSFNTKGVYGTSVNVSDNQFLGAMIYHFA